MILELLFVVCNFNIIVGIMIIVSYNLKDYNGIKVYGFDGV